MQPEDFDKFSATLEATFDVIGKSPAAKTVSPAAKALFFSDMKRYPLDLVISALAAHRADGERGKFTPTPADLIYQIDQHTKRDTRPGAEEAWATALLSRDESATVVWTQETATAFGICSSVLATGDEVGARMAFKEAYARLVSEARKNCVQANWVTSLGWDIEQRKTVLKSAVIAGLLPGKYVAGLLPPPKSAPQEDTKARAQLQNIREMLQKMNEEKATERELHAKRERDVTTNAKQRLQEMTENYKKDDAAVIDQIEQEQVRRAADEEY